MKGFIEFLNYLLPAALVALLAYYMFRAFLENERKNRENEARARMYKTTITLRLQAYERVILFLERISPENIILRVSVPGVTAGQLQAALTRNIREEFEHNITQQLYLSPQTWELVRNAKEESIRLVNSAASRVNEDDEASGLVNMIFELYGDLKRNPVSAALESVRMEGKKFLQQS